MTIRFILLLILLLLSSTVFAACGATQPNPEVPVQQESQSLEGKSGFTTLTGTLTMNGSTGQLQTSTGPVAVESLAVDLIDYNGLTVTVTGKYSGDTLFVSEISTQ